MYWVKRNPQHEEQAYQMLLACKFAPMQTNNLALEKGKRNRFLQLLHTAGGRRLEV